MGDNEAGAKELKIRYTIPEDLEFLTKCFREHGALDFLPINDEEVYIFSKRNVEFANNGVSITGICNNNVRAIANIFINPFVQVKHHGELGVIVDKRYRRRGIGSDILNELIKVSKEKFSLEIVYAYAAESSGDVLFFQKMGFVECGFQSKWIKVKDKFIGKHIFQKFLDKKNR